MDTIPAPGSFAIIRFGANATQTAYVSGHTKTGRAKVRAWNATRTRWMPNLRTLDARDFVEVIDRPLFVPNPPELVTEVPVIWK
jgi:hypothetical protein